MRPSIRILDDTQLELVLHEALRILEEVGVRVAGESMRARLFDEGFTIDDESGRTVAHASSLDKELRGDMPAGDAGLRLDQFEIPIGKFVLQVVVRLDLLRQVNGDRANLCKLHRLRTCWLIIRRNVWRPTS